MFELVRVTLYTLHLNVFRMFYERFQPGIPYLYAPVYALLTFTSQLNLTSNFSLWSLGPNDQISVCIFVNMFQFINRFVYIDRFSKNEGLNNC